MLRRCVLAFVVCALARAETPAIDRAFDRLYNFDFAGAFAILDEHEQSDPAAPLSHAVRAAAILFSEMDRMKILASEFFIDDDTFTGKRPKADAAARARLFGSTAEARRLAAARLKLNPADREAMLAMCMAFGVETDYTVLVEKRWFRSYSLAKQSQTYAHKLLALSPPVYDAYLTLGSVEYMVGSMNFLFRLFIRFDRIKGSKQKAAEDLQKVVAHGRYFPAFAKILLAVIHLREKRPRLALPLLQELVRDYPENPLLRHELQKLGGGT